MAVAFQRRIGDLRGRPVAAGGVQFRIDRPGLDIVHRDATAADFPRQPLREHLDGAFGRRVSGQPRRHVALAHAGSDHDDPAAVLDVFQRRQRSGERAAHIDIDDAVEFFERRLGERLRDRRAGIVHQHIKPTERCDSLFHRQSHGRRIHRVRLDGDGLASGMFDFRHHGGGRIRALRVGDCHVGALGRQPFGDARANAPRTAGDQSRLVLQVSHDQNSSWLSAALSRQACFQNAMPDRRLGITQGKLRRTSAGHSRTAPRSLRPAARPNVLPACHLQCAGCPPQSTRQPGHDPRTVRVR